MNPARRGLGGGGPFCLLRGQIPFGQRILCLPQEKKKVLATVRALSLSVTVQDGTPSCQLEMVWDVPPSASAPSGPGCAALGLGGLPCDSRHCPGGAPPGL